MLQFQSHKFNKQGKITLNLKPFHLALVQSHFVARDNQGRSIPDLVSCITQQPKYVKDRTRRTAGSELRSSLLQCNITMIGQADQEKILWLPLTENFYRGYLLPSGQKYQQLELSFQRIKVVKIQAELGPIHLYKEYKLLIKQQWARLHQTLRRLRIRKIKEVYKTFNSWESRCRTTVSVIAMKQSTITIISLVR